MEFCPDCRGIWFERIEIDRILLKLNEIDFPTETKKAVNNNVHKPVKEQLSLKEQHSPIMDSIYASKELHHLHNLKGKPHWIHRLFD
jgi:Zn-finger nucleic acid-binding protein